jgi:ArsR family transcriptional regulator, arsenate/arsenite/antimonite-responsive transcriptional repressor
VHHLRILREAGVLENEKVGKEVYFWLNKAPLVESLQAVLEYVQAQ